MDHNCVCPDASTRRNGSESNLWVHCAALIRLSALTIPHWFHRASQRFSAEAVTRTWKETKQFHISIVDSFLHEFRGKVTLFCGIMLDPHTIDNGGSIRNIPADVRFSEEGHESHDATRTSRMMKLSFPEKAPPTNLTHFHGRCEFDP